MGLAPPKDIIAALKDYGCDVYPMAGWVDRGRPYPFDPIGQVLHHDAFSEDFPDWDAARYMTFSGRPDLPPPLCNGAIGEQGTVYLCAYGNANHAGWNRRSVIERLRANQAPLGRAYTQPYEKDTVVGNSHLWGWECRNSGTGRDPWEQIDVMARAFAALADACGWSANQIAAHAELTTRKPDPAGIHMPDFRFGVALNQLAHHQPTDPTSPFTPDQEDEMSDIIRALYNLARGSAAEPYDVVLREPLGFMHWHAVAVAAGPGWRQKLNGTLVPALRRERPDRTIPDIPIY